MQLHHLLWRRQGDRVRGWVATGATIHGAATAAGAVKRLVPGLEHSEEEGGAVSVAGWACSLATCCAGACKGDRERGWVATGATQVLRATAAGAEQRPVLVSE